MENFNLAQVNLLLIDPDSVIRQALRNILVDNGFRNIRQGVDVNDLMSSFRAIEPDLLICDMDIGDFALAPFVHRLRHHDTPANPFIPVIATTWNPTPSSVRQIINAGADDLLCKPLSAGQILARIKGLVLARKPFVVTCEYIGPERRKIDDKRESTIAQISVPNVLRTKALAPGKVDPSTIQRAIDDAVSIINLLKLERNACQIQYLVDRIVPTLAMFGELDDAAMAAIERLTYLAEDMIRRMKGAKYAHIIERCQSMTTVSTRLHESDGTPKPKDVRLLKSLAQSILADFSASQAKAPRTADKTSFPVDS